MAAVPGRLAVQDCAFVAQVSHDAVSSHAGRMLGRHIFHLWAELAPLKTGRSGSCSAEAARWGPIRQCRTGLGRVFCHEGAGAVSSAASASAGVADE